MCKKQYVPTTGFYSQIIESLYDYSIFTVDIDLTINSWSAGSKAIFGYEADEMIGQHFSEIFTEKDKKNGIPEVEISTASKQGRADDNRWHICKDRSEFFARGVVFPLKDAQGNKIGYVKILRDLTEKKKSEEAINSYVKELEELNTHKESILAIVSHDLRSPLSGIIGIADFLQANFDTMEKSKVKAMLDLLYTTSQKQLDMLDYLVEWARIKYAAEAFTPTKIELVQYVDKVFESFGETALVSTINLHHEIEENVNVFADGKMLISILQNIVSNAIKHTRKGGSITVKAKKKTDKIVVEIKDTGVGMTKEIQAKLFMPQVEALLETKKKSKGAGIGLLLVKGFLEKNDGEIWVESEIGVGSSFYFTLPATKFVERIEPKDEVRLAETIT